MAKQVNVNANRSTKSNKNGELVPSNPLIVVNVYHKNLDTVLRKYSEAFILDCRYKGSDDTPGRDYKSLKKRFGKRITEMPVLAPSKWEKKAEYDSRTDKAVKAIAKSLSEQPLVILSRNTNALKLLAHYVVEYKPGTRAYLEYCFEETGREGRKTLSCLDDEELDAVVCSVFPEEKLERFGKKTNTKSAADYFNELMA